MTTAQYLFEVRFAEAPPRLLRRVAERLSERLLEDLRSRGIKPSEVVIGRTPRRLMACLEGLPLVEPDREVRELGPSVAEAYDDEEAPTEALSGFAERVGLAVEELEQIETERGLYLAASRQHPGRSIQEVLVESVSSVLCELNGRLPYPLSGRLGEVLSLLDGQVLELEVPGATFGAKTVGHPVLSPKPFAVRDREDYFRKLRKLGIEVIPEKRRSLLKAALEKQADQLGGVQVGNEELLDRWTDECEIPGVIAGRFDSTFTTLPGEVLLAVLNDRLRAFGLRRHGGQLMPHVLTFMDRPDDPRGFVQAGQERVATGRLIDARFRYEADQKLTLAERSRQLDGLDFHHRLGSYAAKTGRVRELVELACRELGWQEVQEPALEAVALLKADLTTGIVRDYPSLRGTIGGIYARQEGYIEVVWQAIYEQYQGKPIPQGRVGQVIAVVDRLDSLVGFFGIGQTPSGSKDSFGLRRLARGLLRIIVDGEIELDLDLLTARAVLLYGDVLERSAEELLREMQTFLAERFRHLLGQRGLADDEISAAEAIGVKNLPDLLARTMALRTVREDKEFRSLVLAAKRIFNIIKDSPEYELRPEELADGAERDLWNVLGPVQDDVDSATAERRYEDGLRSMVQLVPHLDRFFADVLVMDEDDRLRINRIALLQSCRRVFWRIARLKEMAVEKILSSQQNL